MKIMKFVRKVPGGMMVIPFFLAAIINTIAPGILKIGGATSALFSASGANTLIAAVLFCSGAQLRFQVAPKLLARSGVLLIAKFLAGFVTGLIVGAVWGPGGFMGISTLAIFSAVTNSNGGMRLALTSEYGNDEDIASGMLLGINDGPFLTMVAVGAAGTADVPLLSLVASIVPLLIGCIMGNLDEDIAKFTKPGIILLVPFFSFCLGASINFKTILGSGLAGIVLGLMTVVISGAVCIFADRLINRQPGYHGAAISTAAGNAVATPALIAASVPAIEPYVESATAQIATAVVVTAILTPILTAWIARKFGCPKFDREAAEAAQ